MRVTLPPLPQPPHPCWVWEFRPTHKNFLNLLSFSDTGLLQYSGISHVLKGLGKNCHEKRHYFWHFWQLEVFFKQEAFVAFD
jgi:hypothetical protein